MLFSEPKIPQKSGRRCAGAVRRRFQCSSASRKFLKARGLPHPLRDAEVSVLFSEPKIPQIGARVDREWVMMPVSVLFSEPKIPQTAQMFGETLYPAMVSVLFSEPKIPQTTYIRYFLRYHIRFSALQRAENSSKRSVACPPFDFDRFSALQRAENSSKTIISPSV